MASIQSTVGLVTGIDIGGTVDKLMALAAKPRDLLAKRNETLKNQRVAVTDLSALLLATRYITDNLGKEEIYDARAVASSQEGVLSAKVTDTPALGDYQFTVLRTAQRQQWLSEGVRSSEETLGAGTLSFRYGAHVQRSLALEELNGGEGIDPGKIRITDRRGMSAEIDLSSAQTLDDVLSAINENGTIDVTAEVVGDHLRLVDHTGLANSNLKVEEVRGGTTAASLGLAGLNVADTSALGEDIVRLGENLAIDSLNDGTGIDVLANLNDISVTLSDGTKAEIDLPNEGNGTLGDILEALNSVDPDKLWAEIGPDGDRLVVHDLSGGTGTFRLEALYGSTALAQLGLDGEAVDGTITGSRLLGGLQSVLLGSLNGGAGLGTLGELEITDRAGNTATVNLGGSETLEDVIGRINAAGLNVSAQVNAAQNGLELVDTSASPTGKLIVANSDDGTTTADKLGLAVDAAVSSVNSGDLHLQVIARNMRLSDMFGGAGLERGVIGVVDTMGRRAELDLTDEEIQTVGDLVDRLNRLSAHVLAEINETGDGIRIRDLAGGAGRLQILDLEGTSAAQLHLAGTGVDTTIGAVEAQVIDGSLATTVEVTDTDTLDTLITKINQLGVGVTAAKISDGSSRPYRLSLTGVQSGTAANLVIDASDFGLNVEETVHGADALMAIGSVSSSGKNVLVSSKTNTFAEIVPGLTLQARQASLSPVTVTVSSSDTDLVASVKVMVDNYNKFRKYLATVTAYDATTDTKALLAGDSTALRLDSEISYLLSGRFLTGGSVQSLGEVGVTLNDDGTLTFDEDKLTSRFESDPEGVRKFFTDEDFGFSARFGDLVDQLSGPNTSLLAKRFTTLGSQIEDNEARLEDMDERLDVQEYQMLLEFYRMETAISKLRLNLDVLNTLNPVEPVTSSSGD